MGQAKRIGMRIAKVVTKLAMAKVLTKFNLDLDDVNLANRELEIDPLHSYTIEVG